MSCVCLHHLQLPHPVKTNVTPLYKAAEPAHLASLIRLFSSQWYSQGTTFSQYKKWNKAKSYFVRLNQASTTMLKKVRRPRRAQSRGSNHWHARKRLPRERITALNLLGLCHFVTARIPSRNHSSPSPHNQQWRKDPFCPCEPDTWLWYEQLSSSHKGESFCSDCSTNSHFWPCRVNSQVSQQGEVSKLCRPF